MINKDNLYKAVSDDNIELIRIISKESLSKEQDDEVEYYYNYSVYNTNPKLLISFLDNKIIDNKDKVITIFDHIIEYLKVGTLKENVERFIVSNSFQNNIDIEPYLLDYYEYTLGYKIQDETRKYDIIIITDENKEEYKRSNHLVIDLSNLPKYDRTYLASLIVLFKNSDLIIDTSKQTCVSTISKLAKYICNESSNKLIITSDESVIHKRINKIDNDLLDVSFYDKDTNELLKEIQVKHNENVLFPNLNKDGYDIVGYYLDSDNEIANDCIFTNDTIIYVKYHSNTCTVKIMNGDGVIEVRKVTRNSLLGKISIKAPTGYAFKGLYYNKELTKKFIDSTIISDDLVLYVKIRKEDEVEFGEEIITFGRYPQSVVLDKELISILDTLSTNENGYYEYNGHEYAKIIADTNSYEDAVVIFSDSVTEIYKGYRYYFLVEPINWYVLSRSNEKYLVISECVLDKHEFYTNTSNRVIDNTKVICPNNYEYSTVREWLNNDFYNKAFNDNEKEQIKETLIDNTSSIANKEDILYNDTLDKVYLLSYKEAINKAYGFDSTTSTSNTRVSRLTDYARAIGCWINTDEENYGDGFWWLRSRNIEDSRSVHLLFNDGCIDEDTVISTYRGIRPVINIKSEFFK